MHLLDGKIGDVINLGTLGQRKVHLSHYLPANPISMLSILH